MDRTKLVLRQAQGLCELKLSEGCLKIAALAHRSGDHYFASCPPCNRLAVQRERNMNAHNGKQRGKA